MCPRLLLDHLRTESELTKAQAGWALWATAVVTFLSHPSCVDSDTCPWNSNGSYVHVPVLLLSESPADTQFFQYQP